MKRNLAISGVILAAVAVTACGKKSDSTTTAADPLNATVSSAADEAADSIVEQTSSSGSIGSGLVETDSAAPIQGAATLSRTCTESSPTAVVTETFSGSETKSLSLLHLTADFTLTVSGTQTRTWTPPTGQAAIACNNTLQRASINWASDAAVTGLRLDVTADRTINRSKTITNTRKNITKSKTDDVVVKGARAVIWTSATTSGSNTTRTKVITSAVARTRTFTDPNGVDGVIATTVATKSGAELNVAVTRVTSTGALVQKVINSGTLVATNSGGIRSECTFSGVTFDLSGTTAGAIADRCRPTAGTISCDIYNSATAATKSKTVTIQFGASTDSSVSISVDGATAEDFSDYNSRGCDLEKAI